MIPCHKCGGQTAQTDQTCPHCGVGLSGAALLAQPTAGQSAGTPPATWLVMILALVALAAGVLSLSNATMGVGFVAVACFLAIWGRIIQASAFHKELMRRG